MATASASTLPAGWRARLAQRAFRTAPGDRDPVILRHSRIYILPTKRGWAMMATLLTMLLASLNYALSLGIGVTFLLTGVVAAALLHTFRNLAGIEITPLSAGEAFAGGEMSFAMSVHGGTNARSAVTLTAQGAHVTADVPAGAALTMSLDVATPKRGRLPLGRVTLTSDYPYGMWRGWAYVHFPLEGIVFPTAEVGPPPLPSREGGAEVQLTGRGEDIEFAGLRDFQRGDPPQRVAWKAVARGAGWYTKEFDGAGGGGPVALSWRTCSSNADLEARLSRLCAWVLAAERVARPFSLEAPGASLPTSQGREHRRAALAALACVPEESVR